MSGFLFRYSSKNRIPDAGDDRNERRYGWDCESEVRRKCGHREERGRCIDGKVYLADVNWSRGECAISCAKYW